MAKLDIPRFRYLFQDPNGNVFTCTRKPHADGKWFGGECFNCLHVSEIPAENWRDTLIDLDVDDYDFEDGILRRIEK